MDPVDAEIIPSPIAGPRVGLAILGLLVAVVVTIALYAINRSRQIESDYRILNSQSWLQPDELPVMTENQSEPQN